MGLRIDTNYNMTYKCTSNGHSYHRLFCLIIKKKNYNIKSKLNYKCLHLCLIYYYASRTNYKMVTQLGI